MDRDLIVFVKSEDPHEPRVMVEKDADDSHVAMLTFVPDKSLLFSGTNVSGSARIRKPPFIYQEGNKNELLKFLRSFSRCSFLVGIIDF